MAASKNSTLISMLDPQAQMSINQQNTGTASYTRRTGTGSVTAKPTVVSNGVTEDQANIIQGQGQVYDPAKAMIEQRKAAAAAWAAANGDTIYSGSGPVPGASTAGSTGGSTTKPPPSTGSTTPTPETPRGPVAPKGPAGAEVLSGYTEDEIAAALAGLEAQFGMTRAQLLADQSQAGAEYRLLLAQLERGRVQGIETATNDAVRRGIYRSGILGENIADVETSAFDQRIQAEKGYARREEATEAQLRNLQAMETAQAAQIEAGLRRQYAQTLMQAGINPGGYNPNGIYRGGMDEGGGGGSAPNVVGGYNIDPVTGLATTRVDAAQPAVNTQGVGAMGPSGTSVTPVATSQWVPDPTALQQPGIQPTPMPQIIPNPPTSVSDPRRAYDDYMKFWQEQVNGGHQMHGGAPSGPYRVY